MPLGTTLTSKKFTAKPRDPCANAVVSRATAGAGSKLTSSKEAHRTQGRAQLVQQLQNNIRHLETAGRVDDGNIVHSGCTAVDHVLPDGGYHRGTLVEWVATSHRQTAQQSLASGGFGADFLSLVTAQRACEDGGALVIVDPNSQFYPPAAIAMGISFSNTIILRPGTTDTNELYWAIDQALRCEAVGAVWGMLDHIGERWFRRFQLSAEASGVMGLFVRPSIAVQNPTWAEVQWQLAAAPSQSGQTTRVCELKLLRCRGSRTGQRIQIEIDTITGSVHGRRVQNENETLPLRAASQLAHPASRRRAARA